MSASTGCSARPTGWGRQDSARALPGWSRRCKRGSAAQTIAPWCLSGGADIVGTPAEQMDGVLDESDQDVTGGCSLARIAQHDRHIGIKVECSADIAGREALCSVKAIHCHDERRPPALEIVD